MIDQVQGDVEIQLSQHPGDGTFGCAIPGSLHAYPHADSSLLQVPKEFLRLAITVVQFLCSPHSPVSSTKNAIV